MRKLKIMTVVGTRPEIIRLSSIINLFDKSNSVEHILVHTGQNYDYELNEIFFEDLNIRRPDYFLESATGTAMETIGNIISNIDPILIKENPDSFLVLGDTNSCLSAYAAKRRQIPVFHMEAGNRCFDERVPEETNRRLVDHISDINMPYSTLAREHLIREGLNPDRVIKTGSPMYEVLLSKLEEIDASKILETLKIDKNNYFLVSAHRQENIDDDKSYSNLVNCLNYLCERYNMPVIFSAHPRTMKRIKKENTNFNDLIRIVKPFGFIDYNQLQKNAFCVLSDSGTISEETAILNLKSINIREAQERPEAMEVGIVPFTGLNVERIIQSIENHIENNLDRNRVLDYSYDHVSLTVLNIIISYTDYINKKVYYK